jgi:hypothetical protein
MARTTAWAGSAALAAFMAAMATAAAGAQEAVLDLRTGPPDGWADRILTPLPPGTGPVTYRNVTAAEPRRDWAVVLYSGGCEEHPGVLCATQGFGPCTGREAAEIMRAAPEGFAPHRIALLPPGEFLTGEGQMSLGPRGPAGDPSGDPPV